MSYSYYNTTRYVVRSVYIIWANLLSQNNSTCISVPSLGVPNFNFQIFPLVLVKVCKRD